MSLGPIILIHISIIIILIVISNCVLLLRWHSIIQKLQTLLHILEGEHGGMEERVPTLARKGPGEMAK